MYINAIFIFTGRTEGYSKSCQTSKMELFTKIVKGFLPLTIFTRKSILDV